MKKINLPFLFPFAAFLLLIAALSTQLFDAPPMGKFLDPFGGAVQNGEQKKSEHPEPLTINGLNRSGTIRVYFDDRNVPHIFAGNTADLYFAQGYVTASLRLWQMDFISYAAAGRLSEIFKEGFLDHDRRQRRMGIPKAAKASLDFIQKEDPQTFAIISAYTDGVNAYMKQMNNRNRPFEYKLLDYEPEPWTNLKTLLIMKNMADMLSGYDEELSMSNMILALGEKKFNLLFPDFLPNISPIVHGDHKPEKDSLPFVKTPDYLNYAFLSASTKVVKSTYNPKLGSNNWAVSGKKTRSGFPILCNDPHLGLSLPCIWVEMQLTSPEMNVYGVSIPGTPSIVIGFNENIAWGVTNGEDEVRDRYKLKVSPDYKTYELDGKQVELSFSVEEIKRRGQKPFMDTVYESIQGPIPFTKDYAARVELVDFALRWELQNPSDDIATFIRLNRAKNYEEFKEAIQSYACPIQNFVFAGKDNVIAIHHQGKMLARKQGQGKFITDGTKTAYIPHRYIPNDSLPHLYNPACGYVFSANQHPTEPGYPYYYNGYYAITRANQINRMLAKESAFDIAKMKQMQLDNTNSFAVDALPVLVGAVNKSQLDQVQKQELEGLSSWNGAYDLKDTHGKLFDLWMEKLRTYTWDELKAYSFFTRYPEDDVLMELIKTDPANDYFDMQSTSRKETAGVVATEAFLAATAAFEKIKKEKGADWSATNRVDILHMTQLPAFSVMDLPSAGTPDAINAISRDWGPSWRMIVELGDRPKAYGIYPGGQSGNIGSEHYSDFVKDWNKGNYYELQFYLSADEASKKAVTDWTLK